MKDIENELKEKYDEVEVPSYMFDTSRVFKRVEEEKKQKNRKIIYIVASALIIIIITATMMFAIPKLLKEDEIVDNENSINKTALNSIDIISKKTTMFNGKPAAVLVIKVNKIEEYCFIDNIPYTKVRAKIINRFLGSYNNEIEAYIPGGRFNISELKDNIKEEIVNIDSYGIEDWIDVTYHKAIFIPLVEENKTYITTLVEIDGQLVVDMDKAYGFKEYDPETNIVKDDMGDVELEIDKYLENINI